MTTYEGTLLKILRNCSLIMHVHKVLSQNTYIVQGLGGDTTEESDINEVAHLCTAVSSSKRLDQGIRRSTVVSKDPIFDGTEGVRMSSN